MLDELCVSDLKKWYAFYLPAGRSVSHLSQDATCSLQIGNISNCFRGRLHLQISLSVLARFLEAQLKPCRSVVEPHSHQHRGLIHVMTCSYFENFWRRVEVFH